MVDYGSRTPSPTSRSKVFDPFIIGPDHGTHAQSTSIIKLEECDRIFCPLCLEKNPTDGVEKASDELFNQYVANLFEALDQNSEKYQLRMIVIPTLTIMLEKRPIIIKSDHEFHNILRIIYKVMTSNQFNLNEFTKIVKICSIVSERYIEANPIPYLSIWKATEHMMEYVEKRFKGAVQSTEGSVTKIPDFFSSSTMIVKTYLEIMGRFAMKKVSDLIFPLYENDDPLKHNKVHYINTQIKCLRFMSDSILNRCWTDIVATQEPLNDQLTKMVEDLYVALNECLKAATRLDCQEFSRFLIKTDFLFGSHHLIRKNCDVNLKLKIRAFLKSYVFFYIESYFGSDQNFREFKQSVGIVETNYKNAISLSNSPHYKKTIFYLLINCVAMKQNSKYFSKSKVIKVIKILDAEFMRLRESKVLIRVYSYLIAKNVPKLCIYDNVERFIIKVWRDMKKNNKYEEFDEEFCYDESVLHWAFEHPDFIKMVTINTIRYINERSVEKDTVERNLMMLMKNKHYKPIVVSYLRDDESAASIINEIVNYDNKSSKDNANTNEDEHEALIIHLSANILALFHDSLLRFNDNGNYTNSMRVYRLINTIVIMLTKCNHFNLALDNQFMTDLFKFVEIIYTEQSDKYDEIIVLTNEFMTAIMLNNSPNLMKILKNLDFTALGYMYHRLADYTNGDQVAESIARLLTAYDNIDYPLRYNIAKNLSLMAKSVLNWTLSSNNDLHKLSLQVAKRIMQHDLSRSTKVYITTGILHMLITKPDILRNQIHLEAFLSLISMDELAYNPFLEQLMDVVSDDTKRSIEMRLSMERPRSPSPVPSFDSDESCNFEEETNTIENILAQLENDELRPARANKIPSALYVSKNIQDQHTDQIDCEAWERRAYEMARHDEVARPF